MLADTEQIRTPDQRIRTVIMLQKFAAERHLKETGTLQFGDGNVKARRGEATGSVVLEGAQPPSGHGVRRASR